MTNAALPPNVEISRTADEALVLFECLSRFSHSGALSIVGQAEEQTRLIQQYISAYNAFDVDGMLALLLPEVRFENMSGGQLTAEASGIDEFARLAHQAKTMFSEREQRITSLTLKNHSVIVSIAYRGRLAVDIPDGPRAGAVLTLDGESEFAFEGGLISKIVGRS